MADVFSKSKRSEVMSRVRGTGNKNTEMALVKLFRQNKIAGWRRNQAVFGKPDFIFPTLKVAIFVDGCFWHGCPRHSTQPGTNRVFWKRKLARNKIRDRLVTRILRARGLRVLRVWQHELTKKNESRLLLRLRRVLD